MNPNFQMRWISHKNILHNCVFAKLKRVCLKKRDSCFPRWAASHLSKIYFGSEQHSLIVGEPNICLAKNWVWLKEGSGISAGSDNCAANFQSPSNFTQAWIRKRFLMKKRQQIRIIRSLFLVSSQECASHKLIVVILSIRFLWERNILGFNVSSFQLETRQAISWKSTFFKRVAMYLGKSPAWYYSQYLSIVCERMVL